MSNKTSDKNVANIEEDVKILEEFAEICKAGLACYDQTREGKALENILAEREQMIAEKKKYTIRLTDEEYRKVIENAQMDTSNDRVIAIKFAIMQQQINEKDKQIQELEEQVKTLDEAYTGTIKESKKWFDIAHNSIPTQVVIDKMEELNKEIKSCDEIDAIFKIKQQQILQELLEGAGK